MKQTGAAPTMDMAGAPEIHKPTNVLRWFGVAVVSVICAWIVYQIFVNPGFQWDIVGSYMLHPSVLSGIVQTIYLTILVMVLGIIIGVLLAVMRLSNDPLLAFCSHSFVWFFRGTPVLVQLVFWYNFGTLFPMIEFGIPFDGPKFIEIPANVAISSFTAALLGLGLAEGAYMGEIIRAGLMSVDDGQTEASKALGHRPWQTFWVVVLPQAMKAIIPPTGNQVIGMLKYTSLASIVALPELMHSIELIYARTFETVPMLIVAAVWYLIMVSVLTVAQHFIEKHYSKGWRRQEQVDG
nr:amino acid ABC transporter permease [Roseovarius pacificus]